MVLRSHWLGCFRSPARSVSKAPSVWPESSLLGDPSPWEYVHWPLGPWFYLLRGSPFLSAPADNEGEGMSRFGERGHFLRPLWSFWPLEVLSSYCSVSVRSALLRKKNALQNKSSSIFYLLPGQHPCQKLWHTSFPFFFLVPRPW